MVLLKEIAKNIVVNEMDMVDVLEKTDLKEKYEKNKEYNF